MKFKLLLITIVICVITTPAMAGMWLTLTDGSNTMTLDDTDSDGMISYNGSFGAWSVIVTTGISKPLIGGLTIAELDLNNVSVTSSGPGTLTIMLTDTGFSLPSEIGAQAHLESEYGGTVSGTIKLTQILDRDDTQWADQTDPPLITPDPDPDSSNNVSLVSPLLGPGAFSGTQVAFAPVSGYFSLTEIAVINHTGAFQVTSFDLHSTVVPVPAALILGMLGLSVVGIKLRKYA